MVEPTTNHRPDMMASSVTDALHDGQGEDRIWPMRFSYSSNPGHYPNPVVPGGTASGARDLGGQHQYPRRGGISC
jgi:hypothetical protein